MMLKAFRLAVIGWIKRRLSAAAMFVLALIALTVSVTNPPALSCWAELMAQDAPAQEPGPPPPAEFPEPSEEEPPQPFVDSQHPPAEVEAAVTAVTTADPEAVAQALGLELKPQDATGENAGITSLEVLGDLDGDGVPELALRWAGLATPPAETPEPTEDAQPDEVQEAPSPRPVWIFYVLAWDGTHWNAARLMETESPFTVLARSLLSRTGHEIVAVRQEGASAAPYPAVFEFKDHTATLLWDSRSDDSRYQGFSEGEVEFRDLDGDGVAEMIVTGRADPGLLVFPARGGRGFAVRLIYAWDGKGYIPGKTEYAGNEDYTLYRFIAALHLKDYRSAYALIDPAKFLKTKDTSLASFRKLVEDSWPEFTKDSIFEARESGPDPADAFVFTLSMVDKTYIYRPSFGKGPKFLLTGLERREEK